MLQLHEVLARQRLVATKLSHDIVVLVLAQEVLRLALELLEIRRTAEPWQYDRRRLAQQVLEIDVDRLTLRLLDELDEVPKTPPHALQHRRGHVAPEVIRTYLFDQRQLCPHHRDVRLLFERGRHLLDDRTQFVEAAFAADQR
jgi:hypothetical protein